MYLFLFNFMPNIIYYLINLCRYIFNDLTMRFTTEGIKLNHSIDGNKIKSYF